MTPRRKPAELVVPVAGPVNLVEPAPALKPVIGHRGAPPEPRSNAEVLDARATRRAAREAARTPDEIASAHAVSLPVAHELVRLSLAIGVTPAVLLELRHDEHAGTPADRAALARARSEGDLGFLFKARSLGGQRIVS